MSARTLEQARQRLEATAARCRLEAETATDDKERQRLLDEAAEFSGDSLTGDGHHRDSG